MMADANLERKSLGFDRERLGFERMLSTLVYLSYQDSQARPSNLMAKAKVES